MSSASRDLVIRIRGDSAEFVAAVDGAGRHLDDFGRRVESIDRSASATTASLARMGHGLTAFLGVREIIQAADAYGQYASRMRMAVVRATFLLIAQQVSQGPPLSRARPFWRKCKRLAKKLNEVRCSSCRRLLARGQYHKIEIKCPRCKAHNIFKNQQAQSLPIERHRASNDMEASHGNTRNSG